MKKVYKIGTVNSIKEDYGVFKSLVDNSLREITAEQLEGIDSIGQYAFYHSFITNIIIPNSVTSIGKCSFTYCSSLTSITIPDSVTIIDLSAFNSCDSLTSVIIGNSVTTIGNQAFCDCSSLTSVTIGNSVTSISGFAFDDCGSLTTVIINAVTPPTIQSSTFSNCRSLTKIIVPKGSGEAYKSATNWSTYADIIKEAAE